MSEQNETPIVEQNNAKNEDTQVQTNENMIPQSRFNEVNAQKNQLAEKLAKIEQAQEQQRKADLEKQGSIKPCLKNKAKSLKNTKLILMRGMNTKPTSEHQLWKQ